MSNEAMNHHGAFMRMLGRLEQSSHSRDRRLAEMLRRLPEAKTASVGTLGSMQTSAPIPHETSENSGRDALLDLFKAS